MSYNSLQVHRSMIFDQARNEAYFKALQDVINSDSVVLDLGAGLGVHGLLAAKLGAKKVYLVEPQDVISLAKQVVQTNEVTDRITCIKGRIEDITLPEQVDVIVSVLTGNLLLQEDLLPSLFYARDTYLRPGGHMIPNAAVIEAAPVSLPDFYAEQIDIWSQPHLNLDFSPARRHAANTIYLNRPALKTARYLAQPLTLMELDFHTAQSTDCRTTVEYKITCNRFCHGVAGWFKMQLGNQWLSTAPHAPHVHWAPAFLPLDPPLDLDGVESLQLYFARPAYGHWIWSITTATTHQQHSTFISQTFSPKALRKASFSYHPSRSSRGDLVCEILDCFDGLTSVTEIASKVANRHPDLNLSKAQLIRIISKLVDQYSE